MNVHDALSSVIESKTGTCAATIPITNEHYRTLTHDYHASREMRTGNPLLVRETLPVRNVDSTFVFFFPIFFLRIAFMRSWHSPSEPLQLLPTMYDSRLAECHSIGRQNTVSAICLVSLLV